MYEASINKGAMKLNQETEHLAQNPLIKEISLLVAQQLIQNGHQSSTNMQELVAKTI